jgi:hypothetical protein
MLSMQSGRFSSGAATPSTSAHIWCHRARYHGSARGEQLAGYSGSRLLPLDGCRLAYLRPAVELALQSLEAIADVPDRVGAEDEP